MKRRASTAVLATCLSSCSGLLGLGGPDLTVTLTTGAHVAVGAPLVLDVRVGASSFRMTTLGEIEVEAPGEGNHPVFVTLLDSAADTSAHARFNQTFDDDWLHWITVQLGGPRPLGFCIGEVLALPAREEPGDTTFLMYGSIPRGAVC